MLELQTGEIHHLASETVARLLPHGDGIRMICEADVSLYNGYPCIVAQADFQLDSLAAIHRSHFPENPVLMGGLLIDAMAQAIALLMLYIEEEASNGVLLYRLDGITFSNPVNPFEDSVTIEACVTKRGIVKVEGRGFARIGGSIVCEVEKIVGVRQNAGEMRRLYLGAAS